MTCKSGASAAAVELEADLVVALARRAVRDGVGFFQPRDFDHALGNERPRDAGAEKVLALVNRTRLHHGVDEVARELFLEVVDVDLGSAGLDGFLFEAVEGVPLPGRCRRRKPIISALYFSLIHDIKTEGVESAGIS